MPKASHPLPWWLTTSLIAGTLLGCTTPLFRGQSPETKESPISSLLADESSGRAKFVGDMAAPTGMGYLRVEGVALVTQLDGTGSDPPPSPLRDQLIKEMQTHSVRRPSDALASKDTAMAVVRGYIPPGAQQGDVFDIEVRVAPRTDTTSLRGGWLMSSRLREMAILDNELHTGHVSGLAQGPIVCDALFDKSQDPVLETRGRVLGGGMVQLTRPLGLIIRDEHTSVKTSSMIGTAINERFFDFDRGAKKGLANPTRDDYVELKIHSRYRENVPRFIHVIRNIAVGESPVDRLTRVAELEQQLLEPTTSQRAALQLEAIGKEAVNALRKGLKSSDPEVRFYAAEALAYLEDADATETLLETARTERAFRWRAMLALAVMDQFASHEALTELMNSSSAETCYGAFRVLRARNPRDLLVRGETLNDEFALHVINTSTEPMIHVSRAKRPEIVLFGHSQRLESPTFFFAGKHILVKRNNETTVKVSRFVPNGDDQHEVCSNDLVDVIRAIAKLDGGYAEILQGLTEAKAKGFLAARLEIDALPRPGRVYHRDESNGESVDFESTESIPDLFLDRLKRDTERDDARPSLDSDLDIVTSSKPSGWLDRMTSWMVVEE